MRIGVGKPEHKTAVPGHVLNDFVAGDREWLDPLLAAIADAAPLLALDDDPGFTNRIALTLSRNQKPGPRAANA